MPKKNILQTIIDKFKSFQESGGIHIGIVLLGAVILYLVISSFGALSGKKFDSYQVISGPLSRNETYTGLILREEEVQTADSNGFIVYYAREGDKINAGGAVYGVSMTPVPETNIELTDEDFLSVRRKMLSFAKSYNPSKFSTTYSFKNELLGNVMQYVGVTDLSTLTGSNEDGTASALDSVQSSTVRIGNQTISKSPADGIILYSQDGYVNKDLTNLTKADFIQNTYKETDLHTSGSVRAGQPIYTIITDEKWQLVIPLTTRQASKLVNRATIRVKFLKDGLTQNGDFSIIDIEGSKYGVIEFQKGLIRYCTDRFQEIELVTNTKTGLKIPLTSLVTKEFYTIPSTVVTTEEGSNELTCLISTKDESGNNATRSVTATIYATEDVEVAETSSKENYKLYYVDKSTFEEGDVVVSPDGKIKYTTGDIDYLEGVYCINKGYAVFCRVTVLDQNEEYAIVTSDNTYGITMYDNIVKNAVYVSESDILF